MKPKAKIESHPLGAVCRGLKTALWVTALATQLGCPVSTSSEDTPTAVVIEGPAVELWPASRFLSFPNTDPGASSPPDELTLTAIGTEPVQVTVTLEHDGAFSFTDGGEGTYRLNPNETLSLSVVFSPQDEGLHQGGITLVHSASNVESPVRVSLEGHSGEEASPTAVPPITPSPTAVVITPPEATPAPTEQPGMPTSTPEGIDEDADGWSEQEGDCDDRDSLAHPGASERCNAIDDDCDGRVDEGGDSDGDGYSTCQGDCDDQNSAVNPKAPEVYGDGLDADCDGIDEGDLYVSLDGAVAGLDTPALTSLADAMAQARAGETIVVLPGVYAESLRFSGKGVTVVGQGGEGGTVLTGDEAGAVVSFYAGASEDSLRGMTLEGGDGRQGVVINDAAPSLSDVHILRGQGYEGGGVSLYRSSAHLQRVSILGGRATKGGGLFASGGSPVLEQVRIEDGGADFGGGAYLNGSNATLRHVTVVGSVAGEGGGIFMNGGTGAFSQLALIDNEATHKGGGLRVDGGDVTIDHLLCAGNGSADGGEALKGGAIYTAASTFTVEQALVLSNRADEGGGIAVTRGVASLSHLTVSGNVSSAGGGVWAQAGSLTVSHSILAFNRAEEGASVFIAEGGSGAQRSGAADLSWLLLWPGGGDEGQGDGIEGAQPREVIIADPLYLMHHADGPWSDDDYHLQAISPARDGGDVIAAPDPDGSTADLGAFGGPAASEWDVDGDGSKLWWDPSVGATASNDCDDLDVSLSPAGGCEPPQ